MTHCVCSHHRNVVILSWVCCSCSSDFFTNVVYKFISNLHAKNEFVGQDFGESEQKPTESTADINDSDLFFQGVLSWNVKETRMFNCIATNFKILFLWESKHCWIVQFPIYIGMVRREREWSTTQRIDMSPHPIICLFWYQSVQLHLLATLLILGIVGILSSFSFHY